MTLEDCLAQQSDVDIAEAGSARRLRPSDRRKLRCAGVCQCRSVACRFSPYAAGWIMEGTAKRVTRASK
jgi:hypothetical protein